MLLLVNWPIFRTCLNQQQSCLKASLGTVVSTALCEAESIVNNRPLTHVSSDPSDALPLTPNDLLQPGGTAPLPPGIFSIRDIYTRRWRHVQHLTNRFWSRWVREYISTIQHRQKWLSATKGFAVNDIVLVADEVTPRNRWPMGRITEVIKGRDGLVRSAVIKTQYSVLKRPASKLCYRESHHEWVKYRTLASQFISV